MASSAYRTRVEIIHPEEVLARILNDGITEVRIVVKKVIWTGSWKMESRIRGKCSIQVFAKGTPGEGTPLHRIHKWRTRGRKLVLSHESGALEDKQKLQMKTFSDLAECLARIPPKITLYGILSEEIMGISIYGGLQFFNTHP